MKKLILSLLCFFSLSLGVLFGCFNDDPSSFLRNETTHIPNAGDISTPEWSIVEEERYEFLQPEGFKVDLLITASFPFTINIAFSGFINQDGTPDTDVVRMILFYYAGQGVGWTVLRDIRDPKFSVVSDTPLPLFGYHCIPSSMGYRRGKVIPIVIYFETKNNRSFDLERFLAHSKDISAANNTVAPAIGLLVNDNRIAH